MSTYLNGFKSTLMNRIVPKTIASKIAAVKQAAAQNVAQSFVSDLPRQTTVQDTPTSSETTGIPTSTGAAPASSPVETAKKKNPMIGVAILAAIAGVYLYLNKKRIV